MTYGSEFWTVNKKIVHIIKVTEMKIQKCNEQRDQIRQNYKLMYNKQYSSGLDNRQNARKQIDMAPRIF